MTALPFLAPLGASTWPEDRAARRALSCALRALPDPAPWRELMRWAFAEAHDLERGGASITALVALLGVSRPCVFVWRASDPETAGLVIGRAPRASAKGDTRAARASRKGLPRGRRPKSTRENT